MSKAFTIFTSLTKKEANVKENDKKFERHTRAFVVIH